MRQAPGDKGGSILSGPPASVRASQGVVGAFAPELGETSDAWFAGGRSTSTISSTAASVFWTLASNASSPASNANTSRGRLVAGSKPMQTVTTWAPTSSVSKWLGRRLGRRVRRGIHTVTSGSIMSSWWAALLVGHRDTALDKLDCARVTYKTEHIKRERRTVCVTCAQSNLSNFSNIACTYQ